MGRRVIFSGGVSAVRNFGMIKTFCLHAFDDWFYPDYILLECLDHSMHRSFHMFAS